MPRRSLTQSRLRWPEAHEVLEAVTTWADQLARSHPDLQRVGVHGSYGRGDAGFGSDLDHVLIDASATGPQSQRHRQWPFETLPLSCDALVLTPQEWQQADRAWPHRSIPPGHGPGPAARLPLAVEPAGVKPQAPAGLPRKQGAPCPAHA